MSFLIKCGKCGNEVKLFNGDSKAGDKIQLIPDVYSDGYQIGHIVNGIDIYCENPECRHEINLKQCRLTEKVRSKEVGELKPKKKSPFLNDKPTGTVPKVTPSPYLKELLERSEKAIQKLKRR